MCTNVALGHSLIQLSALGKQSGVDKITQNDVTGQMSSRFIIGDNVST